MFAGASNSKDTNGVHCSRSIRTIKLVNAKDVLKFMLAAERRGVLKYFEATKHGKAHYERGTVADDFEDGEAAELTARAVNDKQARS